MDAIFTPSSRKLTGYFYGNFWNQLLAAKHTIHFNANYLNDIPKLQ